MKVLKGLQNTWEKIMYILSRGQKRWGIIVLILTFFGALLETVGVSIIVPLVQVLLNPEALLGNQYVIKCMEILKIEKQQITTMIVGSVILLYILKNIYLIFLSWVRSKYSCKIQRELSVLMLDSYMQRNYEFFVNNNTGNLIRGLTNDITGVYGVIYQSLRILTELMTLTCICIYICISDFGLAITLIILSAICLIVVVFGFRKQMGKLGEMNWKYNADLNQHILHVFEGIKEVIVMRKMGYFKNAYEKTYIKKQKCEVGQVVGTESPAYIIEAVCISGVLMTIYFEINKMSNGEEYISTLAALAVAAFRILPSLGRMTNSFNLLTYQIPCLDAVYKNILEVKEQGKKKKNQRNKVKEIGKEFVFKKSIKLENITWKYLNSKDNILENLSLEIKKGQSVALVGQSGSGKTTLVDIILGILTPDIGEVKIDGYNLDLLMNVWNKLIGYVPQSIYLTEESIRNNVAFGIDDENIDDERVISALKQAQLYDVVEQMPKGIYTTIGERGIKLSGGQRQRIAIARALYEKPEIVVFDEATAALDNETEKAVMDAIEALHGNKTLIIIAHRLTTIEKCDVIYEVIDKNIVKREYKDLFR